MVTELLNKKGELLKKLNKPTPHFKPQDLEKPLIFQILMSIPLIAGLIHRLKKGAESAYTLATVDDLTHAPDLMPLSLIHSPALRIYYQYTGVVAAIANFLTIPLTYLASLILGKPSPLKMTHLGEFVYSSVLLLLTVLPLIFPFLAMPLFATSIVIGFASSLYYLYRFYDGNRQVNREIQATSLEIADLESEISTLEGLQEQLQKANTLEALNHCESQIDRYETMAKLRLKLFELIEKQKIYDDANLRDKTVAAVLSFVAFMSLPILTVAPQLGAAILHSTGVLATAYVIGKISALFIEPLNKLIMSFIENSNATTPTSEDTGLNKIGTTIIHAENKGVPPQHHPSILASEDKKVKVALKDEQDSHPTLKP